MKTSQQKSGSQSQSHIYEAPPDPIPISAFRYSPKKQMYKSTLSQSSFPGKTYDGTLNPEVEEKIYNQWKLKKVLTKVKASKIQILFINKLMQNAGIRSRGGSNKVHKNLTPYFSQVFQKANHFIIVVHYLSILCLLLLTSWTATNTHFNENDANSHVILILKILCLCALIAQQFGNFTSHFLKFGTGLDFTYQNVRDELLSYNYINNIVKTTLLVLFIIFPNSYVLGAIYFIFLVVSLFIGVTELAHLQAAYIHTQKREMLWKISKIFGLNVLMVHIMATVVMAMTHLDPQNNWYHKFNLVDQIWQHQYITSFYWSTIIVTTIGFGDISPNTFNEQLVIAFLALVACILLAFNITMFSQAFAQLKNNYEAVQLKTVQFRRMIRRDYKNNVNINPSLKKNIYKFIESLSDDKRQLQFVQKNEFLKEIPDKLRKDYYKNTNKRLFSSIVFMNSLKNQTLSALTQKFSILFLQINERLIPSDQDIKILQQGQVGLTYYRSGSTINGQVIDQIKIGRRQSIGLLTSDFLSFYRQSNYNMIARQFSIVWSMTTENFINVLKNDIMDYEYYFSVLHKFVYDDNEWTSIACPRCFLKQSIKHTSFKCPALSYIPVRKVTIYKSLCLPDTQMPRVKFTRFRDNAPRTSVLKYWKDYLKKNYQLERQRDVNDHIENIMPREKRKMSSSLLSSNYKWSSKRLFYNYYYMDKHREQIVEEERYLNIEVDVPFSFEFYMPNFNPDKLIFTHVAKCQDAAASSVAMTLRNVVHIKGQKFNKQLLGR